MSQRTDRRLSELSLVAGGTIFGGSTQIGRQLGTWVDPFAITGMRFLFALPFCLISLLRSPRQLDVPVRNLVPVGVFMGLSATLFTFAFFNTTIAVTIFGYYLANLLSSLVVGVWLQHEPFNRATKVAFGCSVIAILLIAAGQGGTGGSDDAIGLLLAIGAGLSATALAQEQKRVAEQIDGESIALAQVLGGIVLCAIAVPIVGDYSFMDLSWGGLALVAFYGFLFWICNRLLVFGFRHEPIVWARCCLALK